MTPPAVPEGSSGAQRSQKDESPANSLRWRHFPAGADGFYRAPVLVSGTRDALLIDAGFTFSDGRAVAAAIDADRRRLRAVYISQSDPDYYFSLKPLVARFEDAAVIAAPETLAAIEASVDKKLAVWGPQLQQNGPQTRADIVLPQAFAGSELSVDGEPIMIIDANVGLPDRRYLWAPTLKAVFGGVLVFSGVHVWTADTPTREGRAAWLATLDEMAARAPSVVIAGHMEVGARIDASAIVHTRDYLLAFEDELARANGAQGLIDAMQDRFPGLGMSVALEIGAKVATGEMAWG